MPCKLFIKIIEIIKKDNLSECRNLILSDDFQKVKNGYKTFNEKSFSLKNKESKIKQMINNDKKKIWRGKREQNFYFGAKISKVSKWRKFAI